MRKMDNETLPYALAVIKLLQGVVNNDDKAAWNCLIQYQQEIKLFFSGIGIEVFVQENEGFAFLRQKLRDSDQDDSLPSLLRKDQLTYPVTLLSVLLYEKLIEFDMKGGDSIRLIIDREEIKDSVRIFLPEASNEANLIDKVDKNINKLVEIGFLRPLSTSPNKFEVRRILKAKIPAESLLEIKERLREHAKLIG
jgi:hypothetical protein